MLADKVFIIELLTVDGFAARTLIREQARHPSAISAAREKKGGGSRAQMAESAILNEQKQITYITPCEIPTLEHETGNDTMEATSLIAEALFASAKSTKVFGGLGHDVGVELEDHSRGGACAAQGIRLPKGISFAPGEMSDD